MKELIKQGIKEETVKKLYDKLPFSIIFNIESNIDNVIEIISYLKNINIECIDEILLYKPYIFYMSREKLNKMFSEENIKVKVTKINNDITNLDFI